MADTLNHFFLEIGTRLDNKIPAETINLANISHLPPVFELQMLELIDVAILVRDMKPSTSCGVDGLTSCILKACGPWIFPVLQHLFNCSILTRTFPACWKTAYITPLYKDGKKSDPSNYRPISVLPCIGKLMERIVHSQLYQYCIDRHILTECQTRVQEGTLHGHLSH